MVELILPAIQNKRISESMCFDFKMVSYPSPAAIKFESLCCLYLDEEAI